MARQVAVDWSRVLTKLNLGKETIASLNAFRSRHNEAQRINTSLKSQKSDIDFSHYRSVLKNSAVVDELEKAYKSYKPSDYDLSAQLKAIDAFESKAVSSAEQTATKVGEELKKLEATLGDIEGARPFDQLTVDDVAKAEPKIDQAIEKALKKGRWDTPGYSEKFVDLKMM